MTVLLMTAILVFGLVNLFLCGANKIWNRPFHRFLFPAVSVLFLDSVMFLGMYVQDATIIDNSTRVYPIIHYALLFMVLFGYELAYRTVLPTWIVVLSFSPVLLTTFMHIGLQYEFFTLASASQTYIRYSVGFFVGVLYLVLIGLKLPEAQSNQPLEFKLIFTLLLHLFFTCLVLVMAVLISILFDRVFTVPYYYFKWVQLLVLIVLYFYLFEVLKRNLSSLTLPREQKAIVQAPEIRTAQQSPLSNQKILTQRKSKSRFEQELTETAEKIELFFTTNHDTYLEAGFNFNVLCFHLQIPAKTVSSAFSKVINSSFPDYMNKWRIAHALIRLKENPTISVTELCFFCGYKSRATFYTNFKKETGLDVFEYRKSIGTK